MSAHTFALEELYKIKENIFRYRYEYHQQLKVRLEDLLIQHPNKDLKDELDKIKQKIKNIEQRHEYAKYHFQEELEMAPNLAYHKVFNGAYFEEYAELFPKFLEKITSICENIKEIYLTDIDDEMKRESELNKKRYKIEDLLREKRDEVFEQKVALLEERISKSPFAMPVECDDDYIEFVKTLNPELYERCMQVYEYYQQNQPNEIFFQCPRCLANLPISKALRVDHDAHYDRTKNVYSCEER